MTQVYDKRVMMMMTKHDYLRTVLFLLFPLDTSRFPHDQESKLAQSSTVLVYQYSRYSIII